MAERQVKTGVYNGAGGESARRTLAGVSLYITSQERLVPPIEPVDVMVAKQIRTALSQGRHGITVLDLGSGEGQLLHDVIDHPEQMPQTRIALQEAQTIGISDFNIRFIGLTDTDKIFDQPLVKGTTYTAVREPDENDRINYPRTATNYAYAITNSQTLHQFFTDHNVSGVDLILSTETMMYLPRNIFASTMEDVTNILTVGGRCVIVGYNRFTRSALSLAEAGNPRIKPGSVEALRTIAIDTVFVHGNPDLTEGEDYERVLATWNRLSQRTIAIYDSLVAQGRLVHTGTRNPIQFVKGHRMAYEDALAANSKLPMRELLVYINELEALMNECELVFEKEIRARMLSELQARHPEIRLSSGPNAISLTKISTN